MYKKAACIVFLVVAFILLITFSKSPIPTKEDLLQTGCNIFTQISCGTGNYINNRSNPYVLTCKHVVRPMDQNVDPVFTTKLNLINEAWVTSAKIVIMSKTLDFAILEVDELPELHRFTTYNYNRTTIGDDIFYFGLINRPGKLFLCTGFIAQKNVFMKEGANYDALYVNTISGSSGATVFDSNGKGVGIVCITNKEHTHSFILPINEIRKSLKLSSVPDLVDILDGKFKGKISDLSKKIIETP